MYLIVLLWIFKKSDLIFIFHLSWIGAKKVIL